MFLTRCKGFPNLNSKPLGQPRTQFCDIEYSLRVEFEWFTMSLINNKNKPGPNTDKPCGTLEVTGTTSECDPFTETNW